LLFPGSYVREVPESHKDPHPTSVNVLQNSDEEYEHLHDWLYRLPLQLFAWLSESRSGVNDVFGFHQLKYQQKRFVLETSIAIPILDLHLDISVPALWVVIQE